MRLRLDLSYDGTHFSGWARQPELRTVQSTLESALKQVLRLPMDPLTVCAGRTDAGVHARGQVVHVDLEHPLVTAHGQSHPCLDVLQKSLPKALPPDIVVRGIMEAPEGFDARFSAVGRRYIYRLWDHAQYDPLTLTYTTYYRHTLDTELMNQAAQQLVGLHDFIGFCKAKPEGTTMRHLRHLSVARQQDSSIAITAEADAFCHSMVRSLVGALVNVGRQRRTVAWLADCLQAAGRLGDIVVMPPQGLTLEEVTYPPDHELATRAGEARRRRDDLS